MKKEDLKNKSEKELEKALAHSREEVRKFRFALSGSNARNVKEGLHHKKEVARILTELNSRKNNV